MTTGELARMFNSERRINAKLTVVPVQGWQRGDWFDSTGLVWVNLSPEMRNMNEAALYTGVGIVEYTNVSVGRAPTRLSRSLVRLGSNPANSPGISMRVKSRASASCRHGSRRKREASSAASDSAACG
jgi:Protein of unknown function (DUF1343)